MKTKNEVFGWFKRTGLFNVLRSRWFWLFQNVTHWLFSHYCIAPLRLPCSFLGLKRATCGKSRILWDSRISGGLRLGKGGLTSTRNLRICRKIPKISEELLYWAYKYMNKIRILLLKKESWLGTVHYLWEWLGRGKNNWALENLIYVTTSFGLINRQWGWVLKKKYRKTQCLNEIHCAKLSTVVGHYSLIRRKNISVPFFFLLFVAEKNKNKTSATHETIPLGVQETSALKTATNRWQKMKRLD